MAIPLLAVLASACRTAQNYVAEAGPRYAGTADVHRTVVDSVGPSSLRLVTFNIQFARHIDSAITLLGSDGPLRNADIITLQEMDAPGTARIAQALGMSYVYYPSNVHPQTGRDFGNAILSRWPIVADRKILLPHLGRFERTQRSATAATVMIAGTAVRVYSVHLGTMIDIGPGSRREQAKTILADAAGFPVVVISGDLNSHGVGRVFNESGYAWPTEHEADTEHHFAWDHIFVKGLDSSAGAQTTGVVTDNLGASDHRPVWAIAQYRKQPAADSTLATRAGQ